MDPWDWTWLARGLRGWNWFETLNCRFLSLRQDNFWVYRRSAGRGTGRSANGWECNCQIAGSNFFVGFALERTVRRADGNRSPGRISCDNLWTWDSRCNSSWMCPSCSGALCLWECSEHSNVCCWLETKSLTWLHSQYRFGRVLQVQKTVEI